MYLLICIYLFVYREIQSGGFTLMDMMDIEITFMVQNMKLLLSEATWKLFIITMFHVLFVWFTNDLLFRCFQVSNLRSNMYLVDNCKGFIRLDKVAFCHETTKAFIINLSIGLFGSWNSEWHDYIFRYGRHIFFWKNISIS